MRKGWKVPLVWIAAMNLAVAGGLGLGSDPEPGAGGRAGRVLASRPTRTPTPSPTSAGSATPTEPPGPTPSPTPSPTVGATPTSPPGGSLIVNPYLEGPFNATEIPSWVNDGRWDISIKPSNLSPGGTAARCADPVLGTGHCPSGEDAYLYQVVASDPGLPRLTASWSWVEQHEEAFEIFVYGASSPEGAWSLVWETSAGLNAPYHTWGSVPVQETVLTHGYAYYKFEVHCRFAAETRSGCKITDVLFATGP